jgi:hypothetical protein
MTIFFDRERVQEIIDALRGNPMHIDLIADLNQSIEIDEENEKERKELESQEIWVKCFYNGYFYQFKDMNINFQIDVKNPEFPDKSSFRGTTVILGGIDENHGSVDLTPVLHTLLLKMKENPNCDVRAYATSFSRQMHFNKDLLSTPIPQSLLDLFKTPGLPKVSNALQNLR